MGGLDARALASSLGTDQRIRSITTISSPHRGSFLADAIDRTPILGNLARRWVPGIEDLTERKMALFNQRITDRPGILYQSVTARARFWRMCPILWPCYALLRWKSGPNDGEVSTQSALWGERIEEAPCDHLELIGMRPGLGLLFPFDHLGLYARITKLLAVNGH
jgi:triacylglycerol lipase